MVRIRLRRIGLKNQPTYRLVAADKESPRDGRFLEILGFYNPRTNPITLEVKEDKIYDWMSRGAQPTESTLKLFNSIGLMDRFARFKAGETLEKLLEEAKAAPRHVIEKKAKPAPVAKTVAEEKPKAKEEQQVEEAKPATKEEKLVETKEAAPAEEKPA